ncbi:MAG: hypothetical protein GXO76_07965 [Calditrichaeota bacterium]|nr:hypothetical protein [Calditrichota bacterium]
MRQKNIILFIFIVIFYQSVNAQEFTKTPILNLFNQEKYTDVIKFAARWAKMNPDNAGVAHYFMAESYYNMGLSSNEIGQARDSFRKAYKLFSRVVLNDNFRFQYPKFYQQALFKKGWCLFRRAETGENPGSLFKLAVDDFNRTGTGETDSLKMIVQYMGAESKYDDAVLKLYQFFQIMNPSFNFSELINELKGAHSAFKAVGNNPNSFNELKLAALLRMNDAYFLLGKLYQNLDENSFNTISDAEKKKSSLQTAEGYFLKCKYLDVLKRMELVEKKRYAPAVYYLEAMKYLNLFQVTKNIRYSSEFKKQLSNLRNARTYSGEILFRRGNLVQFTKSLNTKEFIELTDENTSYYARVTKSIPEAYFWLGILQYLRNDLTNSQMNLVKFVKKNPFPILDPRLKVLVEEAKLKKYTIDFEQFSVSKNRSDLRILKQALNSFNPESQIIKREKGKLLGLVRLELGEDLWSNILTGTTQDKLALALEMIRDILPRAATNIGEKREYYLKQLEKIFKITRYQKSNETTFYEGIEFALKAEIQPTQSGKEADFQVAAKILKDVRPPYQKEAEYVAARSLFFARDYENAKRMFIELVNGSKSARSLYYLGEIFRRENNDAAAKVCFEKLIELTKNRPLGTFWYNNAKASLQKCRSQGDVSVLASIHVDQVRFPDELLKIGKETISYEKLASKEYLEEQAIEKINRMLLKFGLPKKNIYPSKNLLTRSLLKDENLFSAINAGIQDKKGAITANLILWVINEKGKPYAADVFLSGTVLEPPNPENPYVVKNIPLNTTLFLKIEAIGYYPVEKTIRLVQPNDNEVIIPLSERVNYSQVSEALSPGNNFQTYRGLIDNDVLLTNSPTKIPEPSRLASDFNKYISFRDAVYHGDLEEFLVADAMEGRILKYNSSGAPEVNKYFNVEIPDSLAPLKTPEGIAVDSDGKIYIADWVRHRILILNSDGSFIREIGGLKAWNSVKSHAPNLVFPKRIAIEEDAEGVLFRGKKVFREKHILVSDLYGIKKLTLDGRVLDKYLIGQNEYALDNFYGLLVKNYGAHSKLYVYNRKDKKIMVMPAEVKIQ